LKVVLQEINQNGVEILFFIIFILSALSDLLNFYFNEMQQVADSEGFWDFEW